MPALLIWMTYGVLLVAVLAGFLLLALGKIRLIRGTSEQDESVDVAAPVGDDGIAEAPNADANEGGR